MNHREAFLAAADQIEQHPETYRFASNGHPDDGPACMFGWVGKFLGVARPTIARGNSGAYFLLAAHACGGIGLICNRMDMVVLSTSVDSAETHIRAAKLLRTYADMYYPAQDPAYVALKALLEGGVHEIGAGVMHHTVA